MIPADWQGQPELPAPSTLQKGAGPAARLPASSLTSRRPDVEAKLADKNFELLKRDPYHASLRLKDIGVLYTARTDLRYRAFGVAMVLDRASLDLRPTTDFVADQRH